MSTHDLQNWVKRLETQKEAQITKSLNTSAHILYLPPSHRSINTVCYQQSCFTVPCASVLPHIQIMLLILENTAAEVLIITYIH